MILSTDTNPHPAITLQNITKIFGRFAALRDITAEFPVGKMYVLMGDNGAGKSTLLRIITGLLKPSSGEVISRGDFGYMAHASMLYDELSAMENLIYFARLYGRDKSSCARAMDAVNLDPILERPVRDYSQGMRQRLSLARAILHDPGMLILDEPFSNVDGHSSAQMTRLLTNLRDQGKTVLLVTHQPSLLSEAADEFITMSEGRITERRPHFERSVS